MNKKLFKGIQVVDGTSEGFDLTDLSSAIMYLVRTNIEKTDGYIYFNGKKYGTAEETKKSDYIKNYATQEEYNADTTRQTPNVCYIEENDELIYNN